MLFLSIYAIDDTGKGLFEMENRFLKSRIQSADGQEHQNRSVKHALHYYYHNFIGNH